MTEEHTITGEEQKSATISIDSSSTAYCHKESCEEYKKKDDDQTIEIETTIETSVEESSEKNIVVEGEGKDQIPVKITEEANSAAPEKEIDELALWRANNKKNKKQIKPSNLIKNPNDHDVLLGRGKPFQNHDGNQNMLSIVDIYRTRYHESERAFKHEIIEEVLNIIKSKGGRFLERIDDFEKSFWNQVPHRMAYRKVGHAFRSHARRLSMEKRGQAQSQRRNASTMAHASMRSQFLNGVGDIDAVIMNEGMIQTRIPLQGISISEMLPMAGGLGLADAMGMGRSMYNNNGVGGVSSSMPSMYRQGGGAGAGLNRTQRELLAQEQMLHSSQIERILGNSSTLNHAGSTSPHVDGVHSMLGGGGTLSYRGGNALAERSQQIDNMRRRLRFFESGGGSQHSPTSGYPFTTSVAGTSTTSGSQLSNIGLSNIGSVVGDSSC